MINSNRKTVLCEFLFYFYFKAGPSPTSYQGGLKTPSCGPDATEKVVMGFI